MDGISITGLNREVNRKCNDQRDYQGHEVLSAVTAENRQGRTSIEFWLLFVHIGFSYTVSEISSMTTISDNTAFSRPTIPPITAG